MPVAVSSGFPQQSGIMIPEIWSGKLLAKFYARTVFGAIANTDYEGEIKNQGDTVHIRTTPDITVSDYTKGMDLDTQLPAPGTVDLTIDKAKYWNFLVEDVDKAQSDYDYMEDWTKDAANQVQQSTDRTVLSTVYTSAATGNKGATAGKISGNINLGAVTAPLALTKDTIIDFLVNVGLVLDEQNAPDDERYITLPQWAVAMIKRSDLKAAYLTGDSKSILRNKGIVGSVDRLTILGSNNIASVNDTVNSATVKCYHGIANHKSALTYAAQFTKNETIRAQSKFGDLVRGLLVYGFKVVKGDMLVDCYITPGS